MLTTLLISLVMSAPPDGCTMTVFYGPVEITPAANGEIVGGYLIGEVPGGSDAGCALVIIHDTATGTDWTSRACSRARHSPRDSTPPSGTPSPRRRSC